MEEGAPLVAAAGQAWAAADPLQPAADGSSRPAAGEVETFMVLLARRAVPARNLCPLLERTYRNMRIKGNIIGFCVCVYICMYRLMELMLISTTLS